MEDEVQEYFDDISGEVLPPDLVRKARREEMDWIQKIELYDKEPRSVAWVETKRFCLFVGSMSTRATSRPTSCVAGPLGRSSR